MRRITLLSLVSLLVFVVWSGCNVESVTPDNSPKTVTTTVAGQVVDESGKPVQGAQIAAYGKTAVTTQYGTFLIKGVAAPQERCLVKVSKSGYFDGFRAEQPLAGGIIQMRIGLMSNAPQGSFPASAGRTVTAQNSSASVAFPPNGYVTENGASYTGEVSYVVRHLDPTAPNFFDFFSGDFQGVRTDGSVTEMLSYGVLQVELTGGNGEKLNLATGKKATVSYPLPTKMTTDAPAEMPLWWFDEAKGMWKEEGKATREGNFYVGTVSHFTPWNCDDPSLTTMLRVHVTCGNEGVAGVLVHIGERIAITDTNGYVSSRGPAGIAFIVKVHAEANDGLESADMVTGPYTSGTTNQLELPLTTCPAYIKGDVYDCGDSPIDGTVIAEYDGGGFIFGFAQNGGFRLRVQSSVNITIKALTQEGKESKSIIIPPLKYNEDYDTGMLNACNESDITANDYDLNNIDITSSPNIPLMCNALITADGLRTFVFYGGRVTIVNTVTSDILRVITYSTPKNIDSLFGKNVYDISADGSLLLVGVSYRKYVLYNANSGLILREFNNYDEMFLSPDGATLCAFKQDNLLDPSIVVLNASTGIIITQSSVIGGYPLSLLIELTDFFTNNTFGIVLAHEGKLRILNTTNLNSWITINSVGRVVCQSPDGSVIGIAVNNMNVSFYNIQSSEKLCTVNLGPQAYYELNIGIAPFMEQFVGQLFQDDKYSAPSLYHTKSGKLISSLPAVSNVHYRGLNFSGDGKKLVGAYIENNRLKLRVWNFQ